MVFDVLPSVHRCSSSSLSLSLATRGELTSCVKPSFWVTTVRSSTIRTPWSISWLSLSSFLTSLMRSRFVIVPSTSFGNAFSALVSHGGGGGGAGGLGGAGGRHTVHPPVGGLGPSTRG